MRLRTFFCGVGLIANAAVANVAGRQPDPPPSPPSSATPSAIPSSAASPAPVSALSALCAVDPLARLLTPAEAAAAGDALDVEADVAEAGRERAVLSGSVRVSRAGLLLEAPEVTLDRGRNILTATDLRFGSPDVALTGARGSYDVNTGSGQFEQTQYFLAVRGAQGSAGRVVLDRSGGDGAARGRLEQVSYSTCARGDEFWQLRAASIDLDEAGGRGEARDVTLRLGDVPVAYLPYLSFPIDDRRHSGFLTPRLGYSSDNGVDLRVPYYWNIAPNQDLTLYPRLLARRGVMLGAEYRYLGAKHRGEAEFEYLPHDRKRDEDRGALKLEHRSNLLPRFYTDLLYQKVSDDDYLDDLSNNLTLLSPNYLERHLDLRYAGQGWNLLGRVQAFQTIDAELFGGDEQPYGRLPQLLFDGDWSFGRAGGADWRAGARAELVRFDTDSDRVTGRRVDLLPHLEARWETPWGYLSPRLGYRYTGYDLDKLDDDAGDASPGRSAPIFSVDSGVFLERPLRSAWPGDGLLTLEPRLFYLFVPERDHGGIPRFDTTELDPSLAFLFVENRFTGADRLGDANQLSASLTARFLPAGGGGERLHVSVGQALYFDRPRVGLDGEPPENDDSSDFFAEARLRLNDALTVGGALRWDPERARTERSALDLRYRAGSRYGARVMNVSHRFARAELEQLDLSAAWPIDGRWRTFGRWNYSLRENNVVDAFAGVEYGDCCWALRVLARHHRDEPDDRRADNALLLELELKGLTGIGNRVDRLLEEGIFGYDTDAR